MQKLEALIGMGQLEEVIQQVRCSYLNFHICTIYQHSFQAEYELETARMMKKYKPWEPLVEPAAEGQWRWPIH